MHLNPRDLAAGALFVAIGLFFAINAWLGLRIGEAQAMGPGYFPVLLGAVLTLLGLAIAGAAIGRPAAAAIGRVPWLGIVLVTASVLFFAVTVRKLGLGPAVAGATILAALSSRRMSSAGALALGLCLAAFCVAVFVYGLGLPYPVIGPWLRG
jgi:putative tricarboxylic transport membrane protein